MGATSLSRFRSLRIAGLLAVLSGLPLLGIGRLGWAQQETEALARVRDLNKRAVDAYENLELEEARKHLTQALDICASEGLNRHPLKATTHLNLGVVLVGGFKQRDGGTKQFRRALEIDPNIRVPKRLDNPEIQSAFEDATREQAGGAPLPAEPGPAPRPPVASTPAGPPGAAAILHSPVTDARPSEDVAITATVEDTLRFDRLVLAYRPEGASDFLARDMEGAGGNQYAARIPEPATRGGSVAYYIEARGRGGQALARNGSPDEPHVITLGTSPGGEPVAQVDSGDEPEEGEPRAGGGARGRYWLSFGVGAGAGYAKGRPEVSPQYFPDASSENPEDISISSFAPANLLHFSPEVGYFYSSRLLLSLQGRLQYTTGATEFHHSSCGPTDVCKPATGAVAVLARATYLFNTASRLQPFLALQAGGGFIRYTVNLKKYELTDCGKERDAECIDTIAGGGVLLGPSGGVMFGLSRALFLNGTVTTLLGLPKTALNFDVNVGVGYRL